MILNTNNADLFMRSDVGTTIRVVAIASSMEEANALMNDRGYLGLLRELDGYAYLARLDDLGHNREPLPITRSDYDAHNTFSAGDRIELHPGTDSWMQGARYGTVQRFEQGQGLIKLDRKRTAKWLSAALFRRI